MEHPCLLAAAAIHPLQRMAVALQKCAQCHTAEPGGGHKQVWAWGFMGDHQQNQQDADVCHVEGMTICYAFWHLMALQVCSAQLMFLMLRLFSTP